MAECIEREALIEKLRTMPIPKQAGRANTWLDNCAAGVNAAIWEVASFPAADDAPVVRCKDCKHLVAVNVNGKGIPTCRMSGMEVAPAEFCSYGERKDGGADHGA